LSTRKSRGNDQQPEALGHGHEEGLGLRHSPVGARQGAAGVVGAAGFIGSALVGRLRASGVEVKAFTRTVSFMAGRERLAPDASSSRTVFWLAASVNPAVAEERPDLVKGDLAIFEQLLRGAEATSEPPRIVLLSSGGVIYDPDLPPPYREDSPVRATTAYGESKLSLERLLWSADLPDDSKVVVRVSNAYGPGQPARRGQGVIAHWLHAASTRQPLVLLGAPETMRDYVYVGDIVDALVTVHRTPRPVPPIVNVGSGHGTSLDELANVVLDVVDDPALKVDARPARAFDLSRTWLDIELAARTLDWRPRTSLRDGVAAAWASVRERGDAVATSAPAPPGLKRPSSPPR
jgi:UDP-glucose 4-epimerase